MLTNLDGLEMDNLLLEDINKLKRKIDFSFSIFY